MPHVTLSELRNDEQVRASLAAGEIVELREGSELVGRILPVAKSHTQDCMLGLADEWPDFGAETRAIFGNRILPGSRPHDRRAGEESLLSVYADTSVFVSAFLNDAHSHDVERRLASTDAADVL